MKSAEIINLEAELVNLANLGDAFELVLNYQMEGGSNAIGFLNAMQHFKESLDDILARLEDDVSDVKRALEGKANIFAAS